MRQTTIAWFAIVTVWISSSSGAAAETSPSRLAGPESQGAEHIAARLPRVVYQGGPFLRRPRVVTVTFAIDDPAFVARLERFGAEIGNTPWWREAVAGYCAAEGDCIGDGRPGLAVRLDEVLPARVHGVDISALLRREAQGGRFGTLDAESLFMVYLPPGVVLFDAFYEHYCDDGPRAFHRALRWEGGVNGFAVIPRCGDESATTATASHELVEVATNPETQRRGFAFEPHAAYLGFAAAGVEPMDPCGILSRDSQRPLAGGFAVQRAWSNRAASLGRDPCGTIAATDRYVALVPRQPLVRLLREGDCATLFLDAAAGGVDSAGSGKAGAEWRIAVVDLTGEQDGNRYIDMALDRSTVTAGETVQLTLELRQRHPGEMVVVGLLSQLGGRTHLWPLAVRMR